MLKVTLWGKDDFFQPSDELVIEMDASAVKWSSEPIPVFRQFYEYAPDNIVGFVSAIRIRDGEVIGAMLAANKDEELLLRTVLEGNGDILPTYRLCGHFHEVVETSERKVTHAMLRELVLNPIENLPVRETTERL